MADRARLIDLLKERSVRRQSVVLASGRESDFYVDARQTTLHPEGAALIAELLIDRLPDDIVGVGGPVTGADPIVGAVVARSWSRGRPLRGFMVRKQPKSHGLGLWVEGRGNFEDGEAVCVIEDTVTTGGSLLEAVRRVEETGLRVALCLTVVDRLEGARGLLSEAGHSFEALVDRNDLL